MGQTLMMLNVNRPVGLGLPSRSHCGYLEMFCRRPRGGATAGSGGFVHRRRAPADAPLAILREIRVADQPVGPEIHHRQLQRVGARTCCAGDVDPERLLPEDAEFPTVQSHPGHHLHLTEVQEYDRGLARAVRPVSGSSCVGRASGEVSHAWVGVVAPRDQLRQLDARRSAPIGREPHLPRAPLSSRVRAAPRPGPGDLSPLAVARLYCPGCSTRLSYVPRGPRLTWIMLPISVVNGRSLHAIVVSRSDSGAASGRNTTNTEPNSGEVDGQAGDAARLRVHRRPFDPPRLRPPELRTTSAHPEVADGFGRRVLLVGDEVDFGAVFRPAVDVAERRRDCRTRNPAGLPWLPALPAACDPRSRGPYPPGAPRGSACRPRDDPRLASTRLRTGDSS